MKDERSMRKFYRVLCRNKNQVDGECLREGPRGRDRFEAVEAAQEDGWYPMPDGTWVCPRCWEIDE
jgi:hypothetical protein